MPTPSPPRVQSSLRQTTTPPIRSRPDPPESPAKASGMAITVTPPANANEHSPNRDDFTAS